MDGMASAALLVRYHKVPLRNIMFIGYEDRRLNRIISEVGRARIRNGIIILSDFAINDHQARRVVGMLRSLKKGGNRILWFDHHQWSDRSIGMMLPYCDLMIVGENRYMCGAEMLYKSICPRDRLGDRIARLAHTADFNLRSARDGAALRRIAYAISYSNGLAEEKEEENLRAIVGCVSGNRLDSPLIKELSRRYLKRTRSALRELLGGVRTMEVHGIRMGIGFGMGLHTQEVCMAMLKRYKLNIAVYIDAAQLRGHMRSDSTTDCSRIALLFKGGGHPRASGYVLSRRMGSGEDEKSRNRITSELRRAAAEVYGLS